MEQNFNPIYLEYIETKKVSLFIKIIALILVLIFMLIPMSEILTYYMPPYPYKIDLGCLGS